MRIKKTSQTTPTQAQVVNVDSNSTEDTYSCNKINEKVKEVYSTDEQVIGTWIDGKPLYRRVVEFNSGSIGSHTIGTLSNDVSANIDKLVAYDGMYYLSGFSTVKINLYFSSSENSNIYTTTAGDIKEFHQNSSYNNKTIILTFLYTKTTD